ncbi:maltokinase N-terminal cap-like domain-containing protein [Streptomyces reniochalinae]|uniref:1,4-alpha-glucan branching protein n=1 Tax=Streptomyces reniochalinae TaxID=2250578 RepID=A0A367EWZ3_9ACTN|nr:1,4-alpha-glucan branching protein [Streptomyces reniochalinae]RCG22666.1 1,4-alpha-glucan branching protein [Streptomyces reniochalinae]
MSIIYRTTLRPTKLELLEAWLPSQPWYVSGADRAALVNVGGFRLDDPAGEVGVEFMAVIDEAGGEPVTYQVPMAYRSAPLAGADDGLIGTLDHGVLGKRWVYDATHDPVAIAQTYALVTGRVDPQAQNESDTVDRTVAVREAAEPLVEDAGIRQVRHGSRSSDVDLALPVDGLRRLRFLRVPRPDGVPETEGSLGHVTVSWTDLDGGPQRGVWCALVDSGE